MEPPNETQARHAVLNKDYSSIPQLSPKERELLTEYQRLARNLNMVGFPFSNLTRFYPSFSNHPAL